MILYIGITFCIILHLVKLPVCGLILTVPALACVIKFLSSVILSVLILPTSCISWRSSCSLSCVLLMTVDKLLALLSASVDCDSKLVTLRKQRSSETLFNELPRK